MPLKRKATSLAILGLLVFSVLFFALPLAKSSESVNLGDSTTVYYHVETQDIFPGLTSIDVSVIGDFSAIFDSSDGNIQPGRSAEYSIKANQGPGALTVNYNIDRPLLKRSGSKSISINTVIGDSPPITVYDDGIISIVVTIHVDLSGAVSASGPGSVNPETITWSDW